MVRYRQKRGLRAFSYSREHRSFALVAVLLLLSLVVVLVTTLLFLVGSDRTANSDYAEQLRAQGLAQAGIQTMITDLRQEMEAGSALITSANGAEAWYPLTATSMRIMRISNAPAAINHLRSSLSFTPASIFASPDYAGTLPFSRVSALSSTTNSSQNGRIVPYPAFWDQVYLYDTNLAASSKPYPPSWIYIQRSGVSTNSLSWSNSLADKAQGNSSYVLGRYAYQLYDEGGLLDLNVAGGPTSLSAADRRALEGTLAGVPLTNFLYGTNLTASAVADLIQFRNSATQSAYVSSITNTLTATNGFMTTLSGNNRFLSRGDLIQFAKQEGFTAALPYLTHFSRDLNAPAWGPTYNASEMGGSSAYGYRTYSTNAASTNFFLPFATCQGGTESDYTLQGTALSTNVPAGTPIVWRRFPLSRIAWLQQVMDGTASTSVQAAVALHFGLNWDSTRARWVYSPSGGLTAASSILTLGNIPATREPNFFELLKAGILSGSLGSTLGQNGNKFVMTRRYDVSFNTAGAPDLQDPNADYQVMKIGAAIIDQFRSGAEPTVIDFDYAPSMPASWKSDFRAPVTGIKNLPYLYSISQYATLTAGSPQTQQAYLEFELWLPHQQPATSSSPVAIRLSTGDNPANSMSLTGFFAKNDDTAGHTSTTPLSDTGNRWIGINTNVISSSSVYLTPKTFLANDSSGASDLADFTVGSATRRAFNLGSATFTISSGTSYGEYYNYYGSFYNSSLNTNGLPLQLEYRHTGTSGTTWVPYHFMNLAPVAGMRFPQSPAIAPGSGGTNESFSPLPYDPRTTRGGWFQSASKSSSSTAYGDGIYNPVQTITADNDGIVRTNDIGTVVPYSAGGASERPIVLNRAFHTPGDMGYAFRDQPWTSVDFRSTNSADAGLLDIFSVYDDPPVTAGHINLNSAPKEVIQAIIAGSTLNEITLTSFTSGKASTVAAAFTNWVANTPMYSRADLASFASTNAIAGFISNNRKFEREGAIRALSGVGQTRTIILLLDLVAQAGFYGPTAASLNDFHVNSQVHYWAHIAIDRFTGQIVDLQIEPVYE